MGVRDTLLKSRDVFARTRDRGIPRDIREVLWPLVKQRPVSFDKFDPDKLLFRSGAHAPMIVWIGYLGRRSSDRLQPRELKAAARGCCPRSTNRSRCTQKQGKGPRPTRSGSGPEGDGNRDCRATAGEEP